MASVADAPDFQKAVADVHERILNVVDKIEDSQEKNKKEFGDMENIAGLLALMQGNKGMDLPALMALCKDKGYDKSFGGEGMFIFVFLLLFLFNGGGWGNLGRNGQNQFASIAGQNLQDIIAMYDKLGQMQASNSADFARAAQEHSNSMLQLDTKICTAIAETISAVRTQGDRNYEATRNVGDAVRDCCCEMGRQITSLGCKVDGLYGHTSVLQERTVNAVDKVACDIENRLSKLEGKIELGFERVQCTVTNTATQQESARKDREIASLKEKLNATEIASRAVAQMQAFAMQNYKPTAYGTGNPS